MYGKNYKTVIREMTIEDAISEAYGEFEQLASEMSSWRDSLEEKFSQTSRYETVSDAASALEEHQEEPSELEDAREFLGNAEVNVAQGAFKYVRKGGISRNARFGNAVNCLGAAVDWLNEACCDGASGETPEKADEKQAALEALRDALQNTVGSLDGAVEFPGMYG